MNNLMIKKINAPSNTDLVFEDFNSFKPKFDGKVNYNILNAFLVPKSSGVYFIYDFRGVLYIGESKNLKNRFLQHQSKEENKFLASLIETPFGNLKFSWVKTKNKTKAVKLQKEWIRFLDPKTNNIKYKTNRRLYDYSTSN